MHKTKQILEKIAQGVSENILVIDTDFNIIWANNNSLKEYKLKLDQMINKKCYKVTHGKDKRCDKLKEICPIDCIMSTGKPHTITHEHQDDKGKKIYVEISVYPIKDENGSIIEFVHIQKDVTEKMIAKKALEESEERHRKLFENSIEGIGISRKGKVFMANKALLDIFGYDDLEEFKKISIRDHVAPEYKKMMLERIIKRENKEHVDPIIQYQIIRKDGKIRDLEASTINITIEGKDYLQTTFRDITQQKVYEDELKNSKTTIENEVKKKTRRINKLNKELEEYAQRLNLKIKKIDERRIPLTQNEKLTFYSLVRYPELTSKELGEKIGLQTSTVNSIKLRLKEEGYFKTAYIPRIDSLGYRLLTISCYELDKSFDGEDRKEIGILSDDIMDRSENVYCLMTRKQALIMNFSKDLSDYRKIQDVLDAKMHSLGLKFTTNERISIPLNNTNFMYYFNFAGMIKNRFDIQIKDNASPDIIYAEPSLLNDNEKKLMYGLVKHPEHTIDQLSKDIGLSVPTICKLKKKLLEEGLIKMVNIPDFSKVGSELISFSYQKFIHSLQMQKCSDNNEFFSIRTNIENANISAHENYTDLEKDTQRCSCDNDKTPIGPPLRMIIPIESIKFSKLDFEPLIKKMFNL